MGYKLLRTENLIPNVFAILSIVTLAYFIDIDFVISFILCMQWNLL